MHAHTPPFTAKTAKQVYDETSAIAADQDAKHVMTADEREAKLRTVAHYIYHAKLLMDEVFSEERQHRKDACDELVREGEKLGLYDGLRDVESLTGRSAPNADTLAKSSHDDFTIAQDPPDLLHGWLEGIPAESSYLASFGPNEDMLKKSPKADTRVASVDDIAGLREHLREYGIGDMPVTLRGIPDSFTDSRGNRITRRDVRSDRHSSQNVTDVVHSAHPMHAEALRLADEPPEDRL